MWEEIRYKWHLRQRLKTYVLTRAWSPPEVDIETEDEETIQARLVYTKDQTMQEHAIGIIRSKYLVRQAILNGVPVPEEEESWLNSRYMGERFLTPEAADALRTKIRAAQKAEWDYWAGRITLVLAVVGCVIGVLAYFKK